MSPDPKGLSTVFTVLCIVDLFGVFPVIALARAIIECGWIGVPLAVLIFFLQIYTSLLLGKCWIMAEKINNDLKFKTRYPYAALAELTFGEKMSSYITFVLSMTIFGAAVPHLIVASQNLQLLSHYLFPDELDLSVCSWMLIIGIILCPFMWLGSPKDMKWLTGVSVASVIAVSLLTWICLITDPEEQVNIPSPTWESVAIAFGVLAFQFDIHPMILTVQMDMKEKRNLGIGVLMGFLVTGTLSLITVSIAYRLQGNAIRYNILQGLAPSPVLYATLTLVTLQILLSTVVGTTALFQMAEHKLGIKPDFSWKRCVLRACIVVGIIAIGEIVPRLDIIMSLVGALMTGQVMFIWPVLFYRRLRGMSSEPPKTGPRIIVGPVVGKYGSLSETTALILSPPSDAPTFEDMAIRPKPKARPRNDSRVSHISSLIQMDPTPEGSMPPLQKIGTSSLVFVGLVAIAVSTFYSLKGAILYSDFTPPCITNITYYFM